MLARAQAMILPKAPHTAAASLAEPAAEHLAATAAAVRAAPPTLVGSIAPVTGTRLVTVAPDTLLAEVASTLLKSHIDTVVVCDATQAALGVINETVLIHQLAFGNADVFKTRAREVMMPGYRSCHPAESLTEVLARMQAAGLSFMLVMQVQPVPIGVLNVRDGLRALLAAGNHEEALLRSYVMGVGYQ